MDNIFYNLQKSILSLFMLYHKHAYDTYPPASGCVSIGEAPVRLPSTQAIIRFACENILEMAAFVFPGKPIKDIG
jgi:hypothetical protein